MPRSCVISDSHLPRLSERLAAGVLAQERLKTYNKRHACFPSACSDRGSRSATFGRLRQPASAPSEPRENATRGPRPLPNLQTTTKCHKPQGWHASNTSIPAPVGDQRSSCHYISIRVKAFRILALHPSAGERHTLRTERSDVFTCH